MNLYEVVLTLIGFLLLIYYLFETLLFMLILIFGQKACEVWFGKENTPYGRIVVAITWGLVHILTKASVMTGVFSAVAGFLYGAVYLLLNRDIKKDFFSIICYVFNLSIIVVLEVKVDAILYVLN